jgi:hypothetical protein
MKNAKYLISGRFIMLKSTVLTSRISSAYDVNFARKILDKMLYEVGKGGIPR